MTDANNRPLPEPVTNPPQAELPQCRRCGSSEPVDDDGFCARCEKALEQACL